MEDKVSLFIFVTCVTLVCSVIVRYELTVVLNITHLFSLPTHHNAELSIHTISRVGCLLPGHHDHVLAAQQQLGRVPHAHLHLALQLEDPHHALPHAPLPRLRGGGPGPGAGLRAPSHRSLAGPPPGELLVHVSEGQVPVLKM